MSRNSKKKFFIWCTVFLFFISASVHSKLTSPTLSQFGSTGNEVTSIQQKLKSWGYKINKVDGVYGSETQAAVKQFQKNNGLKADGIAGAQTLTAMGIQTDSQDSSVQMLARIISAEARGEPYTGQVAVGAVVLNRVKHPSFPNTLSGVIFQPGAFSAIDDGQWNAEVTTSSYSAARAAINGWDPSYGSIYYYNPAKSTNKWIFSRPTVVTIGKHVFAK